MVESMTDAERQRIISIRMSHPSVGGDLDECAICFLARMIDRAEERADAAEAALATEAAAGFARGVEAMKAGAVADEPIDEAIIVWFGAMGWLATINEESRAYYIARMKAFVGAAVETAARALAVTS